MNKILSDIAKLPVEWHGAGSVSLRVLEAIVRHAGSDQITQSAETGSGKTTLLFSHMSLDHKVFAEESGNRSISVVRESPLFRKETVEFIEGPTQRTLPRWQCQRPLQLALIDGPHAYPFPELEYYYFYPHLAEGALFIVDDVHIPTIRRLYDFLKEDDMFLFVELVDTTAFFRRTSAPLFDPEGDGWWLQNYNKKRFRPSVGFKEAVRLRVSPLVPAPVKRRLKGYLRGTRCR